MNGESCSVQYGKHTIDFSIIRREHATLEIAVELDATVVVVAPLNATNEALCEKVRRCRVSFFGRA
jgi:hypothetical protein